MAESVDNERLLSSSTIFLWCQWQHCGKPINVQRIKSQPTAVCRQLRYSSETATKRLCSFAASMSTVDQI